MDRTRPGIAAGAVVSRLAQLGAPAEQDLAGERAGRCGRHPVRLDSATGLGPALRLLGGEISSTRQYAAEMDRDASRQQAVSDYYQSGFGSSKDALYVEADDVAVNTAFITLIRAVMRDHFGARGFPKHAASIKSQGGTESCVFQDTRTPDATLYPAVTISTSAWDRESAHPVTEGFPPLNW